MQEIASLPLVGIPFFSSLQSAERLMRATGRTCTTIQMDVRKVQFPIMVTLFGLPIFSQYEN